VAQAVAATLHLLLLLEGEAPAAPWGGERSQGDGALPSRSATPRRGAGAVVLQRTEG